MSLDFFSYYHELFLRGKPHLQKYMRRLPKTHKKLPMKKQDEPDFYRLDQSNPLPARDCFDPSGRSRVGKECIKAIPCRQWKMPLYRGL